ncbi:MAG: nucleotidyltransferase domain-containing protein [Fusobacteriaceae bacterium]
MINLKKLEIIKNKLIETYEPKFIYIFGSYAWGNPNENSDLDLLIVTDKYKNEKSYVKARYGHKVLSEMEISKDLLIETSEQFIKRKDIIPTLEYKIYNEGVKLYERV